MKRIAFVAVTLVAALLVVGAPPASAGFSALDVDPTSGAVGDEVVLTLDCGAPVTGYQIWFLSTTQDAAMLVVDDAVGGPGPFEIPFTIPAVLDFGPAAPLDVEPGEYVFEAACSNQEFPEAGFTVTPAPPPTTTTTTGDTTTTTQADVARAVAQQPSFTG